MGGYFTATVLLTDNVPGNANAESMIELIYVVAGLGLIISGALTSRVPTAVVLVVFLCMSLLGSILVSTSLMGVHANLSLLWFGYGCLVFLPACFCVVFTYISSRVQLSGRRTAMLNGGAALAPLVAASGAGMSPWLMWMVFAIILVASAVGVVVMELTAKKCPQQDMQSLESRLCTGIV